MADKVGPSAPTGGTLPSGSTGKPEGEYVQGPGPSVPTGYVTPTGTPKQG